VAAFDLACTTKKLGAPSSRSLRGWAAMLPTAPILTLPKISRYKQHRTRPCKKRKDGAPIFWSRQQGQKAWPPALRAAELKDGPPRGMGQPLSW
jgi:hypothetical protein